MKKSWIEKDLTKYLPILLCWIVAFWIIPLELTACDPAVQLRKKPPGLNKTDMKTLDYLTPNDRFKWKSILNWCDECDERSRKYLERFGDGSHDNGGIYVYPLGGNHYLVDVQCHMTMQQCEHIYYKVTEHADTIESRLLTLEQYYFEAAEGEQTYGAEERAEDPKGEFTKFKDCLTYGLTWIPEPGAGRLMVEKRYRGAGGCGLLTVYDISGECPRVVEFRAKLFCSPDFPDPEQWKLYPADQRARWRAGPNPQRRDWKKPDLPACTVE